MKLSTKTAVLCGAQVGQHIGQHHVAHGVILGGSSAKNRRSSVVLQVIGGLGQARVAALQLGTRGGVPGAQRGKLGFGTFHAAAQADGRAFVAPKQVKQPALHGHEHKQNHPADFKFRRGRVLAHKGQAHQRTEPQPHTGEDARVVAQPIKQAEQPKGLRQHQHDGNDRAAEHQRKRPMQQPAPILRFVWFSHRYVLFCRNG